MRRVCGTYSYEQGKNRTVSRRYTPSFTKITRRIFPSIRRYRSDFAVRCRSMWIRSHCPSRPYKRLTTIRRPKSFLLPQTTKKSSRSSCAISRDARRSASRVRRAVRWRVCFARRESWDSKKISRRERFLIRWHLQKRCCARRDESCEISSLWVWASHF